MLTLYISLSVILAFAIGLLAIPYIQAKKSLLSKSFLILGLVILLFSFTLYSFFGAPSALKQWLTVGKQHYQIMLEYNQLGGIEGIISRIKAKLKANPRDAQGWFILGKLSLANHDYALAFTALDKAQQLQPENSEIRHYYLIAYDIIKKQSKSIQEPN